MNCLGVLNGQWKGSRRWLTLLDEGEKMNVKTYRRGMSLLRIALVAVSALTFVGVANAQDEKFGKQQPEPVGGSLISPADQERYGLVTLGGLGRRCSASLLRNNWIITAAHCVETPESTTVPEDSVTLTANWKSVQVRQSMRIIRFPPYDIAIIRVATPFTVSGSSAAYNRDVFLDGELVSRPIFVYGRGINRFAQGSGMNATPSQSDGRYRLGLFKISNVDGNLYGFPSTRGQSIAGGDSGGPSFTLVSGKAVLVGVHSLCNLRCVPGQTCGEWPGPGPAPAGYSNWMWVTGTPECADAPVAPVWDDINVYLGAFVPPAPQEPRARLVGSRDFSGDGRTDLLWHNGSTGATQIWHMNGRAVVRRAPVDAVRDGGGSLVGLPWNIMNH